ncbi:Putative uncharacterized protein [Lactococcus lactis subsp. lactis A12]|uniref:Uncharacterized protein n=1 Tax=Lactococcus lactis subsp. lactis A12 TaxID=1137134 RepID=S6FES2_LACLL|nr:Putative uncharacterized protein [Lactococcus lactis subsp. lactis A12]SBW29561.1 Hypothetical protein LLA12_00386 [Lactococcus lactis subsp. lactis]
MAFIIISFVISIILILCTMISYLWLFNR